MCNNSLTDASSHSDDPVSVVDLRTEWVAREVNSPNPGPLREHSTQCLSVGGRGGNDMYMLIHFWLKA